MSGSKLAVTKSNVTDYVMEKYRCKEGVTPLYTDRDGIRISFYRCVLTICDNIVFVIYYAKQLKMKEGNELP